MRDIEVIVDTDKFQAEMKRSGNGAVPPIQLEQLAAFSQGLRILTGNNTAQFGGEPSSTGYVLQNGKVTHSVSFRPADIQNSKLRLR
jgi:hypothetical protein